MKILYISQYYSPHEKGGAEVSLRILAENMSKKHEVAVFTVDTKDLEETINNVLVIRRGIPNLSKMLYETLRKRRGKIISLQVRLSMIVDSYHRKFIDILENALDNFKPNIVHLNNVVGFPLNKIYKALKRRGIKIVQTIRDTFLMGLTSTGVQIPLWHWYINNVVSKCDVVHFPSKTIMKNFGGKISAKKVVIPNTVGRNFNEEEWKELVINKRNKIPRKMLYVGTLGEHKGVHLLSLYYKELYKKFGDALQLMLVGDGPLKECLENELKEFIKKGSVRITGWIPHEEVERIMKKAHFIVLPSQWLEMFGRVLIEGFYNGCLPVGSSWGAIPEVIGDKSLIFNNYDQFSRIIEENYDEEKWYSKMNELKDNMKKYSLSYHIQEFERLYENLLKL